MGNHIFLNSDDSQYFYTTELNSLDKYSQELRKTLPYSRYGTMVVSKMVTLLISKEKKKQKNVQEGITRTSSLTLLKSRRKDRKRQKE